METKNTNENFKIGQTVIVVHSVLGSKFLRRRGKVASIRPGCTLSIGVKLQTEKNGNVAWEHFETDFMPTELEVLNQ